MPNSFHDDEPPEPDNLAKVVLLTAAATAFFSIIAVWVATHTG